MTTFEIRAEGLKILSYARMVAPTNKERQMDIVSQVVSNGGYSKSDSRLMIHAVTLASK